MFAGEAWDAHLWGRFGVTTATVATTATTTAATATATTTATTARLCASELWRS